MKEKVEINYALNKRTFYELNCLATNVAREVCENASHKEFRSDICRSCKLCKDLGLPTNDEERVCPRIRLLGLSDTDIVSKILNTYDIYIHCFIEEGDEVKIET